jgi:type IV pilus assembly protein PilV
MTRWSRIAGQRRLASGFTMVEALVALLVLAVGLLGIAALYLDSLRAGREALMRTQAINLAADLGDRIRANRTAIVGYAIGSAGVAVPVAACSTVAGCTPAQLAQTDLASWKASIAQLLPNGTGAVTVTAGTPNAYEITITWTQPGQDGALSFQLRVEV